MPRVLACVTTLGNGVTARGFATAGIFWGVPHFHGGHRTRNDLLCFEYAAQQAFSEDCVFKDEPA